MAIAAMRPVSLPRDFCRSLPKLWQEPDTGGWISTPSSVSSLAELDLSGYLFQCLTLLPMKIGIVRRGFSATGGAEAYLLRLAGGLAEIRRDHGWVGTHLCRRAAGDP